MAERSMEALGQSAAAKLQPGAERRGRRFFRPLRDALSRLRRIRRTAGEDGAARWLLDNWYLAEREGLAALAALSRAKHLRTCENSAVLLRCCETMLSACGGALTEETIEAWLTGFQRALPLTHAEHALLLPAMKAAIVCSLASLLSEEQPEDERVAAHFTSLRTLCATPRRSIRRWTAIPAHSIAPCSRGRQDGAASPSAATPRRCLRAPTPPPEKSAMSASRFWRRSRQGRPEGAILSAFCF